MTRYEWDSAKPKSNFMKHAVHFADTVGVHEDNSARTIQDDRPREDRYVTIGLDAIGRAPVVAYTRRGDTVRVISARKETNPFRSYKSVTVLPK